LKVTAKLQVSQRKEGLGKHTRSVGMAEEASPHDSLERSDSKHCKSPLSQTLLCERATRNGEDGKSKET